MSAMDPWRGRRAVVTGGAGFLGASLCHALSAAGAEVLAIDAMLPGMGAHPGNLEGSGARLLRGDLRDPALDLEGALRGADALFNCAAQTSHAGSMNEPLPDLEINATAQLRLIETLRQTAPRAVVVHASTRQFYGRPQYLPVDEKHPIVPPDANGVSKFAGEQYWLLESRVRGRPAASLRLTNCYGPRLRIRDARQTFLGIWIRRVLEGEPFEVWGGEQLRDLAYAEDVVAAFLAAAVKNAFEEAAEATRGAAYAMLLLAGWGTAVLLAANLGEDADTTAAIAGQIAGALYGAAGIPAEWLDKLVWRERIEKMAGDLQDAGATN